MNAKHHRASVALTAMLCTVMLTLGSTETSQSAGAVTLVQTIDTSRWNPPCPDPSGIAYWPSTGNLVVVDGEVEETSLWRGANLFVATRQGTLVSTHSTTAFTIEPVGIDIASDNRSNRFFIADDSHKAIFEVDLGSDQRFGTADDRVRSFSTLTYGNGDPEGLTVGNGRLYTVDGVGQEVFAIAPGANGFFEGAGDDVISHFDVEVHGIGDPEGIEFNRETGTLFIVDRKSRRVVEIKTDGTLIRSIDLRFTGMVNPGDLAFGPSSTNAVFKHLYVADRGIDNNEDPNENDGKIYEIALRSEQSWTLLLPYLHR